MATLSFLNPFSMDVEQADGTLKNIKSNLREFTKDEKASFNIENDELKATSKKANNIINKIKRLEERIDIRKRLERWEELEVLNEELYDLQDELELINEEFADNDVQDKQIKKRLELCLGDNKEEILSLCEAQGYSKVLTVIYKSIEEDQAKK